MVKEKATVACESVGWERGQFQVRLRCRDGGMLHDSARRLAADHANREIGDCMIVDDGPMYPINQRMEPADPAKISRDGDPEEKVWGMEKVIAFQRATL
jgi:hypothetical protein